MRKSGVKIIFSKRCLEYESHGHPESPERLRCIYNHLKEKKFEFVEAKSCQEEDILRVHSPRLLKMIREAKFSDPDTPTIEGIYEYALLSAGASLKAQEIAINNEYAFSLMRPPGHHASRDKLGGFCYFNNIAIAVSKALNRVKKVAIIDIDCHHGNGTQDIFLGNDRVLYISLHQFPLYPGTGRKSQKNCLNFPLSAETDEENYLKVLKEALKEVKIFDPEVLAISAGFDTYKDDPLTNLNLEKESYYKISSLLACLNKPAFSVLEGGYKIPEIAACIEEYLRGWK
jgi:acetoin utilization deacetylase AcuC-like enzyme